MRYPSTREVVCLRARRAGGLVPSVLQAVLFLQLRAVCFCGCFSWFSCASRIPSLVKLACCASASTIKDGGALSSRALSRSSLPGAYLTIAAHMWQTVKWTLWYVSVLENGSTDFCFVWPIYLFCQRGRLAEVSLLWFRRRPGVNRTVYSFPDKIEYTGTDNCMGCCTLSCDSHRIPGALRFAFMPATTAAIFRRDVPSPTAWTGELDLHLATTRIIMPVSYVFSIEEDLFSTWCLYVVGTLPLVTVKLRWVAKLLRSTVDAS